MYSGDMLFSLSACMINSLLGAWYIQKMLRAKYRNAAVMIVWTVLYSAVQYAASEMSGTGYPLNVAGNAVISFFAFLTLGSLFFRGSATAKMFVSFSFVAGSEIVKFISSALSYLLLGLLAFVLEIQGNMTQDHVRLLDRSTFVILSICILMRSILFFLYLHTIVRQAIEADRQYRFHESLFLVLPGFTVLCTAVLLRMVMVSIENGMSIIIFSRVPATRFWIPFICLLLLGIVLSSVYLFQKMLQGNEEEKKRILLENQITQIQGEVAEIQDIYADMRSLRHDLRSHLANISALVKENVPDRQVLPEYIEKMEMTLERLDFPSQTGNPITDVIIWRKCQEAEKKQIPLQIDFTFPSRQKIDAYDIGIILNNALTNAIEACPIGTNGIVLRSYTKGSLFFIEVENGFDGEITWNEKTGLPISSKSGEHAHGIGLLSVRRCAQKYNGDIDIDISHEHGKHTFQLTVMMCGKDFTPENQSFAPFAFIRTI